MIVGDVNRAIGNDIWGIKGNKDKISPGGHLIRNLLKTDMYVLINNLDIVQGGPWTWVDRQDDTRMSCLDLVIISVSLVPFVTMMIIDVDRKFTPRRVITKKKKTRSIYSDHFSLKIELKGMPRNQKISQTESTWNKGKPGGWELFERITDDRAEEIEKIVDDSEKNIETIVKEINAIDTKIKFKAFGKTKPKTRKKFIERKENKSQQEKDDDLKQKQSAKIEKHIEKIRTNNQGRAGNVFQIKRDITGPKKAGQEASSIKDPLTGEILVTKDDIKNATLKYCVDNLGGNKPDDEVKDMVKKRKESQINDMKKDTEETFEVKFDDFSKVIEKFGKKDTKTYDFLIKAGKKYQFAMYKLCKRIIDQEEIPSSFRRTILYMIWKTRGSMNMFKSWRFLHMKEVLARVVDCLVIEKMKEPLVESSSIYQVGGLPGHSFHEHLLTLKMIMARMEERGEGVIFIIIDYVSFFDREDIFDCLETLDSIKVNKKAKRMWYLLNKDTRIAVKTAHGMTDEEEIGDCLGQGSASAGLISAANLDQGLQKYFNKTDDETDDDVLKYGETRIQPIAYQDDVGSICENVEMARKHADKLSKLTKEKVLEAHPEKSGILILGSKKFKTKVEKELNENPIYLTDFKLDIKMNDKYLGQIIESNLSKSALETVKARAGKIKGAAMEVKSIVEDYQMKAMGGLVAAWEIWEKALIPSLLSGAGTWLGKIGDTEKLCNSIQNFYWRLILQVPESCPKLALLCETKMIDMKYRIWSEKCRLLMRTKDLQEGALAQQVYQQAELNCWPGLGREVKEICQEIQIQDLNKYKISKKEIQNAIFDTHYKEMMTKFQQSRKLADIKDDNFRTMQDYFNDRNIGTARMKFKIRTKMVDKIPGNFKNKYRYKEAGLNCTYCKEEFTQVHCTICPARAELRKGLDMTKLDDMVIYFRRFLTDDKK